MMTALMLFGLRLAPLYNAIAQVESDRGATSENIYQIRSVFVQDINRIYDTAYRARDVYDKDKSEMMMFLYWQYYGKRYADRTGMPVDYEVLARIHNGGPDGCKKQSTVVYWLRVKKELEKMK